MKLTCDKETLKNALSLTERATGKHTALPVLQAVVLSAEGSLLTLRATNLDISIEIDIPAKIGQSGSCAVLPHILISLLSGSRTAKHITLTEKEGVLTFTTEHTESKIKTLPLGDFPSFPTIPEESISFTVSSKKWIQGIQSVVWSTNPTDIRPEFNGVYVMKDGGALVFVGTDSYRLAEKRVTLSLNAELPGILIPQKNAVEIIRICEGREEDLTISYAEHHLAIIGEGIRIVSRLLEGMFPDYKRIIPEEKTTEVVVLKQDLMDALKVANAFSDTWNHTTLTINPKEKVFSVSVKNQDIGETTSRIEGALEGAPLTTACNYRYILEGLNQIKEDSVVLSYCQGWKPILMRGVGDKTFLYLVVPINR